MRKGTIGNGAFGEEGPVLFPLPARAFPPRAVGEPHGIPERGIGGAGHVAHCTEGLATISEMVRGFEDRRYRIVEGKDIVSADSSENRNLPVADRPVERPVDAAENGICTGSEMTISGRAHQVDRVVIVLDLKQFDIAPSSHGAGIKPLIAIGTRRCKSDCRATGPGRRERCGDDR